MNDTDDGVSLEKNATARAVLCSCGHTRGNHRWFAVGGKNRCYEEVDGTRCACEKFVAANDATATVTLTMSRAEAGLVLAAIRTIRDSAPANVIAPFVELDDRLLKAMGRVRFP